MTRPGRKTVVGWLFLIVFAFLTWRTYSLFAMPSVTAHNGDGRFENRSWRFPRPQFGLPIPGYTIDFDQFDLGNEFSANYRIAGLPIIDRELGIYLGTIDHDKQFRTDESRKELSARVEILIVDSMGKTVCHVAQPLSTMWWAFPEGGRDTYGLYDLDGSFFNPRKDVEYQIHVQYWPDPKLSGLRGFFHIRCGGSL